jgi:hypothetical protein
MARRRSGGISLETEVSLMALNVSPALRAPARQVSLLIADVDGTLVTKEKILTERAQRAVRRLHDAEIAFAITSGRPPRGMTMLIGPLDLTTPIAAFNGGMFVHPDLSIIEQRVLPADVAARILPILETHGLDVWLHRGAEWFVRQRDAPHVDREGWTVKFPPTVVASFDGLLDNVVKITGVSDDLEAVARCEADTRREADPRSRRHGRSPTISTSRIPRRTRGSWCSGSPSFSRSRRSRSPRSATSPMTCSCLRRAVSASRWATPAPRYSNLPTT